MKNLWVIFIAGAGILSSCSNSRDLTGNFKSVGEAEPMYKLDQKVEAFRKQHATNFSNGYALGPGSGGTYAAFGSRNEILKKMNQHNEAGKELVSHNANTMGSYDIAQDTLVK